VRKAADAADRWRDTATGQEGQTCGSLGVRQGDRNRLHEGAPISGAIRGHAGRAGAIGRGGPSASSDFGSAKALSLPPDEAFARGSCAPTAMRTGISGHTQDRNSITDLGKNGARTR